jgi:hypothetical protein
VENLGVKYTQRYPIIKQYGRDWMSYPDLRKLNDDYMRDHDPVKFLRGLATSRNFGTMVKKYAAEPTVYSFVKEAIRATPADLVGAALDYLREDKIARGLAENVSRALGLPPGLLGTSGAKPKVDQQAILDSVIKNRSDLQKQLQNPSPQ